VIKAGRNGQVKYDAAGNTPVEIVDLHDDLMNPRPMVWLNPFKDVEFSPLEFGMPPNQLEVTSTMQTLSLGVARDLLRDAGARDVDGRDADWYDAGRTGVVLGTTGPVPLTHPLAARLSTPVLREAAQSMGLSEADADELAKRYVTAYAPWEENSFPGLLANVVAGRVANRLDLGGLNTTVDAACAASLSAVPRSMGTVEVR